jgi:hypothetical protein
MNIFYVFDHNDFNAEFFFIKFCFLFHKTTQFNDETESL